MLAAGSLLVGGCASFSPDGGFDAVAGWTRERTGHTPSWQRTPEQAGLAEARVSALLRQPLDADAAVEVALLNNRGLQAKYAELGMAEADRVRAGRLANPRIGFGHLRGGGAAEIDRSVLFDVLGLLTMPIATDVERRRFEQAQYRAALETIRLASDARKAWYRAVAATQLARYGEQVADAADAADDLARRMQAAGNFNALDRLRQQSFHADAVAQLARARQRATTERERLVRLLGLSGAQLAFTLAERLPDLPSAPIEGRDAEQAAMDDRLDIRLARLDADATARALGLTQATRFVNVLDAGYANKTQTGAPREDGYEVELELPLFDFGATRAARAEAVYRQALERTAQAAVDARSEVRERHSAYRTAYDLAKHYRDEVVPLRKRISDENLLRYNGMLIGVFDLLADAREQVAGITASVEALRDHWLAEADLQFALRGGAPRAAAADDAFPPSAAASPGAGTDH